MEFINGFAGNIIGFWSENAGSYVSSAITILAVLIGSQLARVGVSRITERAMRPSEKGDPDEVQRKRARVQTLLPLIQSVERYTIHFISAIIILHELGVNTSAILASAGVLGLAVGFGAQSLVKDVIGGFFLIFDGLIQVDDIITVGSTTGVVELVDLRNTQLREFNGRLWVIPNGDLRTFGNFSRVWTRAVAEVGIAYEQSVEDGMNALREVAAKWAAENEEIIIEPPEVQGVLGLDDSSVGLRIVAKVKAPNHWATERELRRMIKDHFDARGVEIPFPRRVVYTRQEGGDAS